MIKHHDKAKLHEVPVVATSEDSSIRFDVKADIWDDQAGSLHFHKDHHGMRKSDYHLIEFILDDRTGEHLRFPPNPHDAMWIARAGADTSGSCPTRETGSDYEVITPITVSDSGHRLIVRNANPTSEQWAFTLNFQRRGQEHAGPDDYVSWDPIIDNHDGGS